MSTFELRLMSPVQEEIIPGVESFVAKDASGSFGILAHAFRRVTALSFGMATLRKQGGSSEYLALPGGVLYFANNVLKIATTGYVRSENAAEIMAVLEQRERLEAESVREIKRSLRHLDEEILKRLSSMRFNQ